MGKIGLSSADICAIIKTCSENGVAQLKFGDLEIHFGKPETLHDDRPPAPPNHTRPATEIAATQKQIAKKSLLKDEVSLREDELALMVIENPMEAERLIMAGELNEETTDGTEEQDSYE